MTKVVNADLLNAWIAANAYDVEVTPPPDIDPPPSGDPVPVGFTGNFRLEWRDEFDGSALDLAIWEPNWLAGNDTAITKPINSKEIACFDPRQVKVANGALRIDAIAKSQTATDGKTYAYTSGCLTSQKAKEWTPPIVIEFRCRFHCGSNRNAPYNWPAVWLNGHHGTWPDAGENDVMENLRSGVCAHYHAPSVNWGSNELPSSTDYTQWHTFAVEWTASKLEYRYDGQVVGTVTSGVLAKPNYMVINLGISDTEGGPKQIPSWFEVDYVRVWRRT